MKLLQEGPLSNFLSRLIDLILLNVIWFLCSLPIFTLGASTCAVYEVTMRYAFHGNPPVIRTFLEAFQKNFKKATILFLIFLAAGLFLALDLWCALQWNISIKFLIVVVILSVSYFYLAVLSHVFPVLTYFDTGIKESIRKAFFLSMKNGIFTVFIMLMNLLPVLAILVLPNKFGQIIFLYFVLGFAGIALLNSLHLVRLFDPKRAEESDHIEEQQRQLRNSDKQKYQGK